IFSQNASRAAISCRKNSSDFSPPMIPPLELVSEIDYANHLGFNNTRIKASVKARQSPKHR
ncbi:MAG TPA: hypothetical protein VFK65_04595, partial [Candidatus Binatia bacterium]|nr:hypothetical protein [Candidatus Binatia bacterium]